MNNNNKGLWIVLIIILVVLIIWGIVAASHHNEPQNANEQTQSSDQTQSGASGNKSGQSSSASGNSSASTKVPVISSLSPNSGRAGLTITVNGSNFLFSNVILFNGLSLGNVGSNDAHHTSFVVPDSLVVCANSNCSTGKYEVNPGVYTVNIRNANGTSNTVSYTVTAPDKNQ